MTDLHHAKCFLKWFSQVSRAEENIVVLFRRRHYDRDLTRRVGKEAGWVWFGSGGGETGKE